jgi:hypothetical protein
VSQLWILSANVNQGLPSVARFIVNDYLCLGLRACAVFKHTHPAPRLVRLAACRIGQ